MNMRMLPILIMLTALVSLNANAQTKRPRHGKAYVDNRLGMYFSAEAGYSQSIAENASKSDFVIHQLPSFAVGLGCNFSHIVGMRVNAGILSQTSRCSKAVINLLPDVYGDGRYKFRMLSVNMSLITSITNLFNEYKPDRQVNWSLVAGGGIIRTGGFDADKVAKWNEYDYYPVSSAAGTYPTAHIGLQCAVALSKPLDFTVEIRGNATDNAYNGVNNGNSIDFYADVMMGIAYHWGKETSKRSTPPPYIDPLLQDRAFVETVRPGEEMRTTIPFYIGFYYLNTATQKKVARVADFMRKNPDLKLQVVGHPDVVEGQDENKNLVLASKRADAVRKALVEKYNISEDRITVSYVNEALVSIRTVGEWLPAVSFIME